MDATAEKPTAPEPVRSAAILIAAYGAFVAFNALWYGIGTDFEDPVGAARAFARFGATLLIAWGLFKTQKWAWWVGVFLGGIVGLLALVGFCVLSVAYATGKPIPLDAVLISGVSGGVLATAFVLLLLSPSRRAFFQRDREDRPSPVT